MKGLVAVAILATVGRVWGAECPWYKADIGLMVDMKRCLGRNIEDYTVKPFVNNFVNQLKADIAKDKSADVRVGVMSYGGRLEIRHPLTGSQDVKSVLNAVNKAGFEPGMMTLDEALDDCIDQKCFPSWNDKSRKKIMIILTDAKNENSEDLMAAMSKYKKQDFTFFAYGIDFDNNESSLGVMAESSKYAIDMSKSCKFDKFADKLVQMISNEQCRPTPPPPPPPPTKPPAVKPNVHADVVFVIDDTGSLIKSQWDEEIDLAQRFVKMVAVGATGSRFAALKFNFKVTPGFDWTADQKQAYDGLSKLPFTARGPTFTGKAINYAVDVYFGTKYKPRTAKNIKTHKVIVVITDGQPSKPSSVRAAVKHATSKGIQMVAIGVGPAVMDGDIPDMNMYDIVNMDAARLIISKDFNKLDGKAAKIIKAMQE